MSKEHREILARKMREAGFGDIADEVVAGEHVGLRMVEIALSAMSEVAQGERSYNDMSIADLRVELGRLHHALSLKVLGDPRKSFAFPSPPTDQEAQASMK